MIDVGTIQYVIVMYEMLRNKGYNYKDKHAIKINKK